MEFATIVLICSFRSRPSAVPSHRVLRRPRPFKAPQVSRRSPPLSAIFHRSCLKKTSAHPLPRPQRVPQRQLLQLSALVVENARRRAITTKMVILTSRGSARLRQRSRPNGGRALLWPTPLSGRVGESPRKMTSTWMMMTKKLLPEGRQHQVCLKFLRWKMRIRWRRQLLPPLKKTRRRKKKVRSQLRQPRKICPNVRDHPHGCALPDLRRKSTFSICLTPFLDSFVADTHSFIFHRTLKSLMKKKRRGAYTYGSESDGSDSDDDTRSRDEDASGSGGGGNVRRGRKKGRGVGKSSSRASLLATASSNHSLSRMSDDSASLDASVSRFSYFIWVYRCVGAVAMPYCFFSGSTFGQAGRRRP